MKLSARVRTGAMVSVAVLAPLGVAIGPFGAPVEASWPPIEYQPGWIADCQYSPFMLKGQNPCVHFHVEYCNDNGGSASVADLGTKYRITCVGSQLPLP